MSLDRSTASIAMINLVMTGADGAGGVWQDQVQLIPMGMYDDPDSFVTRIKETLPLVNNLRVLFNEHSFNPDGSLHPQMEAFLTAAVAQGFDLTICYGEGDAQNIGIGEGRWPDLTNAEAYAALEENLPDVAGAWQAMLDWMAAHPAVASGVWGWELMNESAAYRNTVRANGAGDGLTAADFVALYAEHVIRLSQMIDARAEGNILVGGWGYNGDFLTLGNTLIDGQSALEVLRAGVGADLVWSAHFYPGWMGTNLVADPAELIARLDEIFGPVANDAVLITEINADGQIDDPSQPQGYDDFIAAAYGWFADRGIGFGWYPGVQTGASHLVYLEGNGVETYRHQHALAHALNAFSLGRAADEPSLSQTVAVSQVTARLRNEAYEITAGEAQFDTATAAGFAFGFGGNDTLVGKTTSNDFLYGGKGNDLLRGFGADDFLFGQQGDDHLSGGTGIDNLFGGWGADTLDGGTGADYLVGGRQNDTYLVTEAGDTVVEHADQGRDLVQTTLARYGLGENVEDLAYLGTSSFLGTGTEARNRLTGGGQADTLFGLGGGDTLVGGAGNDVLIGGRGADLLSGGAGRDTASYQTATSGVRADLVTVQTTGAGDATGDRFSSVEDLRGSSYDDRLSGNAGANTLWGMAGNDTLTGRGGNDRLYGGGGADRFVFAAGHGADRIADFQDDIDTLVFAARASFDTKAEALSFASQTGADVLFRFGGGDSLLVVNTSLAAIADDIVVL